LTITVDDLTLFSGEVAEFQWHETTEQLTVTARFRAAPGFMDQLKMAAAARQQAAVTPPAAPDAAVPDGPRPTLDVVRDEE
jgi:hypothetical protein